MCDPSTEARLSLTYLLHGLAGTLLTYLRCPAVLVFGVGFDIFEVLLDAVVGSHTPVIRGERHEIDVVQRHPIAPLKQVGL